jgi:predicted amidohydrolase YtcJ
MKAWGTLLLALGACLIVALALTQTSSSLAVAVNRGYDVGKSRPPAGAPSADVRIYLPLIAKNYSGAASTPADTIFYNGVILTMDSSRPQAQAIALRDQVIVLVGATAEAMALVGPQTKVVDLHGLTVMPGFVDPHTHLFNDANAWGLDLDGAQQMALRNGVTTLGSMYTTQNFLTQMQDMAQSGRLRVRTSLYLNYTTNCGVILGDWYKAYAPTRAFGEMLRIGGVKLFLDGGSCGGPAVSYNHPFFGYGNLWLTQEQLNVALADMQASGYQVAMHALGDRALDQALNGLEYVLNGQANTLRHRIEHNAVVRDDLLPRFGQVHPVALIFGAWPCVGGGGTPPAYQPWEWRWGDLLDANPNEHFAWHGDAPFFTVSPLLHLYSMATAHGVTGAGVTCDAPVWMSERTLPVAQALPMMTSEAAYALWRESEVGSLSPGKLADLIILSADPSAIDPEQIKDIAVWMTMVGGSVEYCAAGHESVCPNAQNE